MSLQWMLIYSAIQFYFCRKDTHKTLSFQIFREVRHRNCIKMRKMGYWMPNNARNIWLASHFHLPLSPTPYPNEYLEYASWQEKETQIHQLRLGEEMEKDCSRDYNKDCNTATTKDCNKVSGRRNWTMPARWKSWALTQTSSRKSPASKQNISNNCC